MIAKADSETVRAVVKDLANVGLDESLAVIETEKVPPIVGVPEMMPVLAASVSPAGSLPLVTDQVYGILPPVAARGFE